MRTRLEAPKQENAGHVNGRYLHHPDTVFELCLSEVATDSYCWKSGNMYRDPRLPPSVLLREINNNLKNI